MFTLVDHWEFVPHSQVVYILFAGMIAMQGIGLLIGRFLLDEIYSRS